MNLEINQYPNESLTFNDDDFYDIDFWNGIGFETKKIKGSTIKAGIIAGLPATAWGDITGTLSSQTDLQTALNAKFDNPAGLVTDYLNGLGTPTPFPASLPVPNAQVLVETAIGSAVTTLGYVAIQNIILSAGTWLVEISAEVTNNTNNTSTFIAIGVAGVYEPATGRECRVGLASQYKCASTQKIITFVGTQTISLFAKVGGGTGTIRNRVISAIKLS